MVAAFSLGGLHFFQMLQFLEESFPIRNTDISVVNIGQRACDRYTGRWHKLRRCESPSPSDRAQTIRSQKRSIQSRDRIDG